MARRISKEVWIYVDESQAPNAEGVDDGKRFRVGAFATEQPVHKTVVESALTDLAHDSDAVGNGLDEATLSRGYFHATEDSKNGHSWLCRGIKEHCRGSLYVTHWDFGSAKQDDKRGGRLHRLMILLSSLSAAQLGYHRVNLVIAAREGTFDAQDASDFPGYARTQLMGSMQNHPMLPTTFPELQVTLVSGNDPGVQVADFLLWAAQRAEHRKHGDTFGYQGKTDWLDRVGAKQDSAFQVDEDPLGDSRWIIGQRLADGDDPSLWAHPRKLGDLDIMLSFRFLVAAVRRAPLQMEGIALLVSARARVLECLRSLAGMSPDARRGELARMYLELCDTVPLYDLADGSDYVRHAEARIVAVAILAGQLAWESTE